MVVAAAPRGRRMRSLFGRDPIGAAFVTPYAIFLIGLFGYPLLLALYISFFDYSSRRRARSSTVRSSA